MSLRLAHTLVGGVGYYDLRDHSVGPALSEILRAESWPEGILVEDLSYGPVHVVQRLSDARPPFRRLIVVGAVERGRAPGTIVAYRWDGALPDTDEIQTRVVESLTGIVGLDNLLIVTAALAAPAPVIFVVEVEPVVEALGDAFSAPVALALPRAARLVRGIALDGLTVASLRAGPLGGAAGGSTP